LCATSSDFAIGVGEADMAGNDSGTLGMRFVVILFGAAMVVLGIGTSGGRLSELFKYVKQESTAYAKGLRSAPRRGQIDEPSIRRPAAKNDRARARLSAHPEDVPLDEIRRRDREQLNALLDDL
jgi:hypothetical protein